jgi:hypothetical protein
MELVIIMWSQGSSVSKVTKLRSGRPGFGTKEGEGRNFFFSSLQCPDRYLGPRILLSNEIFLRG